MKNKLLLLSLTSFLFFGCAKNRVEDPLIIPPNFNEMPDKSKKEDNSSKIPDQDLKDLKDLLLKKQ